MKKVIVADEWLDLVDESDKIIGKERRSFVYRHCLSNFRVVNLFILNSKGELWIPRRSAEKRIIPLCLDVSMGGHVESGEDYEVALVREANEELNLDVNIKDIQCIARLTPSSHGVSAFMKVYEMSMEAVPKYNGSDFIEYFWLTPSDLLERIATGDRAKDDLPKLVEILYTKK